MQLQRIALAVAAALSALVLVPGIASIKRNQQDFNEQLPGAASSVCC
jgi:Flp pilus assembly protein TadB